MKNLILSVLTIVLTSTIISAQTTPHNHELCGTVSNEFQKERIKDNKKRVTQADFRMETIYLPVKFHRVGTTSGEDQIKVSSILDQMCRLKRELGAYDIVPYISNGFNDVFDSGVFTNPGGSNTQIVNNKDDFAANVFICENANTSGGGTGTTLGYYAVPFGNSERDYVVVRKKELVDSSSTLTHELGHLLSLDHPFVGWEGVPYSATTHGNPLNVFNVGGGQIELVDRDENCETAADQLCDTPADYNFSFSEANLDGDPTNNDVGTCEMINPIQDSQDNLLTPMTTNHMSYYNCGPKVFTEGQSELMHADFASPERSHLRSEYIPNLNEITEEPNITSPDQMQPNYNSINFAWDPVEHADFYLLEITSSSEFYSYISTEPSIFVQDLSPDETYFYSVAPFNETSTCIRTAPKVIFTGDQFSSIETLNNIADINLYPNPIEQGTQIQIEINSEETFNADLSIVGLDGKVFLNELDQRINANNNLLEVSTESLSTGMYFLLIKSDKGVFSQQIVIK